MIKLALLYPGTGSQYAGMFRKLHEDYAVVRETFDEASEALGMDLARLCFEDGFSEAEGVAHAQAAILACSVAGHRLFLQHFGLRPAMAAGHSLGEWSALVGAGAIDLASAIRLVWRRGKWMEEATPAGGGALAAVNRLTFRQVQPWCKADAATGQAVEAACRNAPDQTVIAGHREAVERALPQLEALGAKVVRLTAGVPFHTTLMRPAAEKLAEELAATAFRDPQWPVLSNVTAEPHETARLAERLAEQLTRTVRWEETMRRMQREGVHYAVEIGPQQVLKQLTRRTARNIRAYALDTPDDWPPMFALRRHVPSFVDRCLAIAVSTRNRNPDPADYRAGIAEPWTRLRQLGEEAQEEDGVPAGARERESLALLRRILACKQVPEAEQAERLAELAYHTNGEGWAQ